MPTLEDTAEELGGRKTFVGAHVRDESCGHRMDAWASREESDVSNPGFNYVLTERESKEYHQRMKLEGKILGLNDREKG